MNTLLNTDGYKVGHIRQYPEKTNFVYSNWTPRKSRIEGITHVVHFGLQHFIKKWLIDDFNTNFFGLEKNLAVRQYKRIMDNYLGKDSVDCTHIEELHDLGYLPILIKSLPEGSSVPMRCPCVTVVNTDHRFFWLTNYIETLMSAELWGPTTSATIAREYKKILDYWCEKTGGDPEFIKFQGHDFSMRGMFGVEAAKLSGMGHLTSFVGTDTIPAIIELEKYYGANSDVELVGCSVPATEHAVMCAGGKEDEKETFRRLICDVYPNGIVSIVSDTWDLWKVLSEYLPSLKNEIMSRNGKVVIRPDSGDPVDIICGLPKDKYLEINGEYYRSNDVIEYETFPVQYGIKDNAVPLSNVEIKGVVESLWDIFGGTTTGAGFRQLASCIGAIYGDSITLERATQICERLSNKGFASTNIVFGIGSYTYQYNTRDTFGFAMKATWCSVNGVDHSIFKDPITDNGTKKSAKGLIRVEKENGDYIMYDEQDVYGENLGELNPVFFNGKLLVETTLQEVRHRVSI
jgi:nicotinamide phosphoribosyltransferase